MKHTILIAAVAAFGAGAAMAQSSIAIYGRLNTTVERWDVGGEKTDEVVNNASRIGFKGSEELGGGLKAHFVLEHGFESDNGAQTSGPSTRFPQGQFWGREATVGLSGAFGTVRLGQMPSSEAYYATAEYVSLHNHDSGTSADALYLPTALVFGQLDSTVAYTTPNFGGATFAIQYGLKEDSKVDNPISIAANYDRGALHLGLGYEEFDDLMSLAVRALYEFGALTVGGYYERNSGSSAALGVSSLDRDNVRFAAMYVMGSSELHANMGVAGDVGDVPDTGQKQFTLAYNYNLSKRTKIYAFYTKIDTDVSGSDFSSIATGVRHNF
jgi:predicted porin